MNTELCCHGWECVTYLWHRACFHGERDQNALLAAWGLSMLGNAFIVAQGLFQCFNVSSKRWVNVEGANDLSQSVTSINI